MIFLFDCFLVATCSGPKETIWICGILLSSWLTLYFTYDSGTEKQRQAIKHLEKNSTASLWTPAGLTVHITVGANMR